MFSKVFVTKLIVFGTICASAVNAQAPSTLCTCLPPNMCYQNLQTDGGGQIDIRIVNPGAAATQPPVTTLLPGIVSCPAGMELCCPNSGLTGCGVRWNIPISANITPGPGQERFGSEPWQALVLGLDNTYVGGGVLIDTLNVLTAAHKVSNRTAATIKVRMGEWDTSRTIEPYNVQESLVTQIRINPSFVPTTLLNDVAILRLATAIQLGPVPNPAINTGCLPVATQVFDGQTCLVAGWGRDSFTGNFQMIMKEVALPIVSNGPCQDQLRATRLGPSFTLDTNSFICAGGQANLDACVGDGGSALVCNVGGRYQIAGLVAWGIGCGSANVPGVYVRVQSFIAWIQQNLF